jgi:uncharacterized membrane protein YkoI
MRNKLTKILAGLAALTALALGGAALASGQGGSQPSVPATAVDQGSAKPDTDSIQDENGADDATEGAESESAEAGEADETPAYQSSITAPEQENASEEAEASALQAKATVTAAQAESAALAAVPGTVGQVELDNENGNVVYSVEITKADGTVVDVKVDAGNATVLSQESGDGAEQSGEAEQPGD